jgi:hypothetical protein
VRAWLRRAQQLLTVWAVANGLVCVAHLIDVEVSKGARGT